MGDDFKYVCKCGAELPPDHKGPCPKCGESGQLHRVFDESLGVDIVSHTGMKVRQKRKGFHKFMNESVQGHFSSGNPNLKKGVSLERTIDKEKDEYHEVVKNAETGETIREVHEPLSQHRHSNYNQTWGSFFYDRGGQLLSRFWKVLAAYSVLILILTATLYILALVYSKGEILAVEASSALGSLNLIFAAVALGLAVAIFLLAFILLFILSFSTAGRRLADKIFGFSKLTKLEKFKIKIDSELSRINERLSNVEKRLANNKNTVQNSKKQEKNNGN